jgi:hypothetical protein
MHFGSLKLIEFFSLLKAEKQILYFTWFIVCLVPQMWSVLTFLALNPLQGPHRADSVTLQDEVCMKTLTCAADIQLNVAYEPWEERLMEDLVVCTFLKSFIFGRLERFSL